MDFIKVVFTAFASLTALFLLTKLIGNKQMSQLNMFDYINGITIGSIAAEMATGEMSDFFDCLIAIAIYSLTAVLLSIISQKSIFLRRFITGKSIVLYDKGRFISENLKTAKIDINEFLVMCRTKGYFDLEQVQTIVLEANGQLSILPKDKNRPITPDDLRIVVKQSQPEVVVVDNGKVLDKNLKYSGNNRQWLDNKLKQEKIAVKDILVAFCDGDNNLKIYPRYKNKTHNDIFG